MYIKEYGLFKKFLLLYLFMRYLNFLKYHGHTKKKNTIPTQIKMKLLLAQIIILGEAEPTCSMQ